MGYYINPRNGETKEAWLAANGKPVTVEEAKAFSAPGSEQRLVCWVDNGMFTAAGIAYDDRERDAFLYPDARPKQWYLVDVAKLAQFWAPEMTE
jgi:hypothetical protein